MRVLARGWAGVSGKRKVWTGAADPPMAPALPPCALPQAHTRMENRISATFTDPQLATVNTAVLALRAALPFLRDLAPNDRRDLAKLGPKSQAFAEAALAAAQEFPGRLPVDFVLADFEADMALHRRLERPLVALEELLERLRDTRMTAGIDAMEASNEVYYYIRGRKGSPRLNEAAAALGRRYDRPGGADPPGGDGGGNPPPMP